MSCGEVLVHITFDIPILVIDLKFLPFPYHPVPVRTSQKTDNGGCWFLGLCSAGFLQYVADANVIPLQGWLHLQHLVNQVHDGGGGVLDVSLQLKTVGNWNAKMWVESIYSARNAAWNPVMTSPTKVRYICENRHYNDVLFGTLASQITSLTSVYSTVYSDADQRKHQKLRVTGLCAGNSPGTGEFPAQMASNGENFSIWWRHHGTHGVRGPIAAANRYFGIRNYMIQHSQYVFFDTDNDFNRMDPFSVSCSE